MQRNVWIVTVMKGIRAFMQSYFVLILPIYLAHFGVHAFGIGLFATASLAVSILYTWVFTRVASRWGSRHALIAASLMMAVSGVLFASVHSTWGLVIAVLGGFMPPSGGVFQDAVEQGLLSHTPAQSRTRAFARYGFAAAALGAVGSLATGTASLLHNLAGSVIAGDRLFFLAYGVVGIFVALLAWFVTAETKRARPTGAATASTQSSPETPARRQGSLHQSRGFLARIAVLYVSDNLGSGLVTSTLMIYWLSVHFGMTAQQLAVLYFGMDVLSAVSYPLAERLSRKMGLINTAVWTHLPCGLMLMAIPFLPNVGAVFALFWVRSLLVEMDVPTRQSFVASVVHPDERTAAAGVTSISEQVGQAFGPAVGGFALQTASAAFPFLVGGALKVVYDLTLWVMFRGKEVRDEADTGLAG